MNKANKLINFIEDIAHLYSFLQSVTGKSGQVSDVVAFYSSFLF